MRKLSILLNALFLLMLAIIPASAQDDTASVRVAHFSPDAPAVDVYVNGDVAVENLQFTEVTAFLELAADTYDIVIAPAGTSIDDAVIAPFDLTVEADSATTVAAVGSVDNGTLDVTVIAEDYSPIPAGNARITMVHAIEGESALDIYGSSILLIQALRYPEGAGDGAFTRDVPVGRYNFEANIAESDDTVRVANGVELADGEYYLIVALGPQSQDGELLLVTPEGNSVEDSEAAIVTDGGDTEATDETEDDADTEETDEEDSDSEETEAALPSEGSAMLRLAHFSPNAPAVDVYVDGAVVVEGLEFPEVTTFLGLAGGDYEVAVAPAGTSIDDALFAPMTITLEDDSNTTVAVVGSVDTGTITATVFTEDYSPVPAGNVRITIVHAVEGESALDIYGSSILLIQALRYPEGAGDGAFTRDVPAGRYNFEANIAESDDTVRVANGVELEDGGFYMIVALGPQSQDGELLIVNPDGYENPDE